MTISPERYGNSVFEVLVIRQALPTLIQTLNNHGIASDRIDTVEDSILSVFPFSIMASSLHFGEEGDRIRTGLLDSTADYLIRFSSIPMSKMDAKQLVAKRLIQYSDATFEKNNVHFSVSKTDLQDLARVALQHMTIDEPVKLSTLLLVYSHFTTSLSTYEGGKILKRLYKLFTKIGEEKWIASMMKVLESGG